MDLKLSKIWIDIDIGPLIAQDLRGLAGLRGPFAGSPRGPAGLRGPEGFQVSILSSISSCILSGICV